MLPFYAIFASFGHYIYNMIPIMEDFLSECNAWYKKRHEEITEKMQPVVLEYIILYNQTCLNIKLKYESALVTYPFLNAIHLFIVGLYNFIFEKIMALHDKYLYRWREPEPVDTIWHEECYYYCYDDCDFDPSFSSFYVIDDCYLGGNGSSDGSTSVDGSTDENNSENQAKNKYMMHLVSIENKCEMMKHKSNMYLPKERLFIVHDKDGYYHMHLWLKEKDTISNEVTKTLYNQALSRARFIIVEYSHPAMKDKIEIKIDPKMMLVGNAILSPCFVWRYLYMMPIYRQFAFDMNYKLTIIDYCATELVLNSNQYIMLGKFDYKVCNI
jgi:hypothetical protein